MPMDRHSLDAPPFDRILGPLNDRQREAVTAGPEPLLILAGAGTGKTLTLAHRVAWLVANGAEPGRILLLTFTRRAASSMIRRADALLERAGSRAGSRIWGGTFHAVAARLLRLHGRLVGLHPGFTIIDRADSEDLMALARSELGLGRGNERRFPLKGTCLDIYSRCIDSAESLEEVLATRFPWCREAEEGLRRLFVEYVDRKETQRVLDYDDLLIFWQSLMGADEPGGRIRGRFDHVLVDEYQDTNRLQAGILHSLCPEGRGLTVVGDDMQSIYSFRHATVHNILDFPEEFPSTRTVILEENYRSTQQVLDACNAVAAQAARGCRKTLHSTRAGTGRPRLVICLDEDDQTDYLLAKVLQKREDGIALKRQAVLSRSGHHSLGLELELARRDIPFRKYGGLRFIETAHVKDLVAFLRWADNPRDHLAAIRILRLLPGVGTVRAQRLAVDLELEPETATFPSEASPFAVGLLDLLSVLRHRPVPDLPTQIRAVRQYYAPLAERVHENAQARLRELEQLEALSGRFASRTAFLAELVLDPPDWSGELAGPPVLDEDYLVLSTIHSAKGLEWECIYVIHAADGNIPSDLATGNAEEIEEERRLLYVALTRARSHLTVCVPLRYYAHGGQSLERSGFAQPSRFLDGEVRHAFDVVTTPAERGREGTPFLAAGGGLRVNPRDLTRALWLRPQPGAQAACAEAATGQEQPK